MLRLMTIKRVIVAEGIVLSLLLLLALFLRLGNSDIIEFKRDEANLSLMALDFANGGDVPLLGIGSSVGFPNAPVNVYILAVPYFFSSDPELATQFIGLLNVFALILTYLLVRYYTNPFIALLMLTIFAINPWSLIFSRKIWAQNMLPVFIVMTMGAGVAGFVEKKRWGQWLCLPLTVITGQIHYVAFVIIPPLLYVVWQGRKSLTRAFYLSLIIAVLLTVPYLAGLYRADLLSLPAIRDAISNSPSGDTQGADFISFEAIRSTAVLIAGTEIHSLAGSERFMDYLDSVPNVYPIWGVLAWAVGFASVWLIIRSVQYRDKRTPIDITLLVWFAFSITVFLFNWTEFFIHYLIPILPVAFIVLGFGLFDLYKVLGKASQLQFAVTSVIAIMLVVILSTQLWLWRDLLKFVDENATNHGFGTPIHYLQEPRDAILQTNAMSVIGHLDGQTIGEDGDATVWSALLYDVPSVRFEDDVTRVYPAEVATLLTDDCEMVDVDNRYHLREQEGCYGIATRSIDDLMLSEYAPIVGRTYFSNGVHVTHYAWWQDDACLDLVWTISQPTTENYMFAVHFFDADGERVAQSDGLSWLGRYWQAGDTVVRTFCLPESSSEIMSVGIGMYTYDGVNFFGVELLDDNNAPIDPMLRINLE